jgi:hypothetical protein
MNSTAQAFTRTGPGWRYRVESIPVRRLGTFTLALGLAAAGGLARAVNLASTPQRMGDEGVLLQRAWTVDGTNGLGRLTDWYDHPPLGWLVLSLWTWATSGFDRAWTAIAAGRSLSIAAYVLSAGLLWLLARRLGFDRWTAAIALALFGLSPLAVDLNRLVSLDNLAVPWLVAAFALAANPRRPLIAFAAGGACLAAAVLTNEVALLFLPLLVWQLRRSSLPSTRRYGFIVGGSLFLAVMAGYVVDAIVHRSLTAGAGHAGLLDGIRAQLVDRPDTGSLLDSHSISRQAVALWFDLDPLGLVVLVLAAATALVTSPRLRPYAVAALVPLALVVVPGFASPSLIVLGLPFGALVVAGLVQHGHDDGWKWIFGEVTLYPEVLAGVALVVVILAPIGLWAPKHHRLLTEDTDAAAQELERWVVANVPTTQRMIVDDALWTDLAVDGVAPGHMTGYAALDLDPQVGVAARGTWQDYDVLVATDSLRRFPARYPSAAAALEESEVVATFGTGIEQIELRRVLPGDRASTEASATAGRGPDAVASTGTALARNPHLAFSSAASAQLVAGRVDLRLMTTLVAVADLGPLDIEQFPLDPAEAVVNPLAPHRVAVLRADSDEAAAKIANLLEAQVSPYRPAQVELGTDGRLTVTYTPAALLEPPNP